MYTEFSHYILILAFCLVFNLANFRFFWIISLYLVIVTISFFSAMSCYMCSEFSIYNIFTNSNANTPLMYHISATWSNHEGSLLLWCWLLSILGFWFCLSIQPWTLLMHSTQMDFFVNLGNLHRRSFATLCANYNCELIRYFLKTFDNLCVTKRQIAISRYSTIFQAKIKKATKGAINVIEHSLFIYKQEKIQPLRVVVYILLFFCGFLLTTSNPFYKIPFLCVNSLAELNPVLQDPILAIHPPCIYAGYVASALGFSLCLAKLRKVSNFPTSLLLLRNCVTAKTRSHVRFQYGAYVVSQFFTACAANGEREKQATPIIKATSQKYSLCLNKRNESARNTYVAVVKTSPRPNEDTTRCGLSFITDTTSGSGYVSLAILTRSRLRNEGTPLCLHSHVQSKRKRNCREPRWLKWRTQNKGGLVTPLQLTIKCLANVLKQFNNTKPMLITSANYSVHIARNVIYNTVWTNLWTHIRIWICICWCFLTIGILLGSWWAYHELGWGGWWFWDPVENASLMPWLGATACFHSVFLPRLNLWTLFFNLFTFVLSILGTFFVRSGLLASVHSFATDSTRGLLILCFLSCIVIISTVLFINCNHNTAKPLSFSSVLKAFIPRHCKKETLEIHLVADQSRPSKYERNNRTSFLQQEGACFARKLLRIKENRA